MVVQKERLIFLISFLVPVCACVCLCALSCPALPCPQSTVNSPHSPSHNPFFLPFADFHSFVIFTFALFLLSCALFCLCVDLEQGIPFPVWTQWTGTSYCFCFAFCLAFLLFFLRWRYFYQVSSCWLDRSHRHAFKFLSSSHSLWRSTLGCLLVSYKRENREFWQEWAHKTPLLTFFFTLLCLHFNSHGPGSHVLTHTTSSYNSAIIWDGSTHRKIKKIKKRRMVESNGSDGQGETNYQKVKVIVPTSHYLLLPPFQCHQPTITIGHVSPLHFPLWMWDCTCTVLYCTIDMMYGVHRIHGCGFYLLCP